MFHVPEQYRMTEGLGIYNSGPMDGNNGVFVIPIKKPKKVKIYLRAIASDGGEWQHVSISLSTRCPTWDEMCFVKDLFWDEDDWVVQYHPPKMNYVNNHPFTLHLWRPESIILPVPPKEYV